ncbi:putative leo1-like protein [Plasmopara halstedii]
MTSSPEAQSGSSSSSEDEFDLGGPSLKSNNDSHADVKPADPDKLFSDDSDEEGDNKDGDDKKRVISPKKIDKDKEMEDLFGSDYDSEEEEFKASGVKESPARDGQRSNEEFSRDDAGDRNASGGGDGDNGYSDNMWLPRTPKAPNTTKYFISKMPNILRFVPEPYTKEGIRAEMENSSDETLYRNYVRWRYKRDPVSGRVLLDEETKLPLRESNAKLVQWEDGTFSMFVGKEALAMSRQKLANSFLFVNEMASDGPQFQDSDDVVPGQESVLECHARLQEKFTIRPMTTASKSHKGLTMSMRWRHNKSVQKMKEYISELDGEREQEQRVKITDEKLRLQNRKKARQGYEFDRDRSSRMDAQFLEDGYDAIDYDDDEHVGSIKEQFGKRKTLSAQRKPGIRRPVPGGGLDEYRSSQRQRELKREREAEGFESDNNDGGVAEGDEEDEEEEMVIRSHKRRTVDEEDSE